MSGINAIQEKPPNQSLQPDGRASGDAEPAGRRRSQQDPESVSSVATGGGVVDVPEPGGVRRSTPTTIK